MLDILNATISSSTEKKTLFNTLENTSLPFDPKKLYNLEHQYHIAANQLADQATLDTLNEVHADKDFIKEAVKNAKEDSSFPLINKGWKNVTILLKGGTKIVIKTPYLRKDWKKITGKKHKKRGKKGSGFYPVLEALGIKDGVSPATRDDIAFYTVQSSSYDEAIQILKRKGIIIGTSALERIASTTAQADMSLRDAALLAAMNIPVSPDGPLANRRVRVSVDGGRTRVRENKKGRKTKNGRHRFNAPWCEPRVIVIDLLDKDGNYNSLRLPIYDTLIDDCDATFSLIIGYLRLLGAAHAKIVEFISDGAEWIWNRVDQIAVQAEIDESKMVKILDFYHASEHLSGTIELCTTLSKKERKKLFKRLRHILRYKKDGITMVVEELKQLSQTYEISEIIDKLKYFENHISHMQYLDFEKNKLPIGSGQVESAVRRVINLRFKAPGSFWRKNIVEGLMHLRACFKSGRWDELMKRFLTGVFITPKFETVKK